MTTERIGKYWFEMLICPITDASFEKYPFYISIRNLAGTPLCDTLHTHRFENETQARAFCQDIAAGRISLKKLVDEAQSISERERTAYSVNAQTSFDDFMGHIQTLGISTSQLSSIFSAYDKLPSEARSMLYDTEQLSQYPLERIATTPTSDSNSFGKWMNSHMRDVDVCLTDGDAREHYLAGVCYLSKEERADADLEYSDLEEWLFSLPVDRVLYGTGGAPLVVLKTEYPGAQTDFLLGDMVDASENQEIADLCERAAWSGAGFSERLAFLRNGTPFEIPFDPNSMDAITEKERRELCSFAAAYTQVYVTSISLEDLYIVYSICKTEDGRICRVDCPICIRITEPGNGLSSSLEGKLFFARQKSGLRRRE